MKVFLMFKDRDFDMQTELPWNYQDLVRDLGLDTLFNMMAWGDDFLFHVARHAVLTGLNNGMDTILYRQSILKDCLKNRAIIKDIYDISAESLESKKKAHWILTNSTPSTILNSSIEALQMLVASLKKLKAIADNHTGKFESEGFVTLFAMLNKELSEEYFASIQTHLTELKSSDGVLISAGLGKGNRGTSYTIHKPVKKQGWMKRVLTTRPGSYTINIAPGDEVGLKALSELNNRGLNIVANALAQSADHILSFFNMLRTETGFYLGCLNLHRQLAQMDEPVSFPEPVYGQEHQLSFKGLYDISLALQMKQKVVDNGLNTDGKNLMIITGANKGGKTTFLRGIGLSQLMMQSGMFVPAESFKAVLYDGLFTHFQREEDVTMESGKLDEELGRLSKIMDNVTPHSLLLFNESFAATSEREGSEIAMQITSALVEKHIKVFFVTHLYDLARRYYEKRPEYAMFLCSERLSDGTRTFKLVEAEPLETSFGKDLYDKVFGKN